MYPKRAVAAAVAVTLMLLAIPRAAFPGEGIRSVSGRHRWSDPAAWSGSTPGAGDIVTISAGSTVILDESTPSLGGLQVDGTLLVQDADISLTSRYIVVHGKFRAGTPKKPFRNRLVITLTGDDADHDVMGMGTKVLGVMGGSLELHGARRTGWTQLSATAERAARRIEVEGSIDWRVGDRIAIASSDYWRRHDEERTITSVSGSTIELDAPLQYRHWGELQTVAGQTVDERAEVALLTRNIVITGDDYSTENGFGGHVMVMDGGRARIDGVELEHMGQSKTLRRYPLHFHMDGAAPDSYVRRSAIHHTFNRCMTIHGTTELRVKDNVCFDHIGHGFFLEDGAETDNVLIGNLGFGTREIEDGLLPSDDNPATFWITNPDNILRGNVAAGSDGMGFWYALPKNPTGLSTGDSIWPRRTPLGEFKDNVAHSNGDTGLQVDRGPRPDGTTESAYYDPHLDPTDPESDEVVARFEGLTAYMNRDRGVWLRGENHVVWGAVLADNRSGATFASSESYLEDSLVVGETANPGMTEPWEEPGHGGRALPFFWEPEAQITGFEFYDGLVGVRRTVFANFADNPIRPAGALGYLAPDAFSIHPKNFAEDVRFVDAERVYLAPVEPGQDGDASKVFVDADGSVTGSPGKVIVVDNPFLLNESCTYRQDWNAHLCDSDYVTFIVGVDDNPAAVKPVTLTRSDGITQTLNGCCDDSDDAVTSVIPNATYGLDFAPGSDPQEMDFVLWRGRGRWLRIDLPLTGSFAVTRWGRNLPAVQSLAALNSATDSTYYYDGRALHLKVMGRGDWEELNVELR